MKTPVWLWIVVWLIHQCTGSAKPWAESWGLPAANGEVSVKSARKGVLLEDPEKMREMLKRKQDEIMSDPFLAAQYQEALEKKVIESFEEIIREKASRRSK